MSSFAVALWNLKVPSGGAKVPGYDDEDGAPLPYRITMAAIDSATPSGKPSTLKLHKRIVRFALDDEEEEEDEEDEGEGDSSEEEFVICTLEAGKVVLRWGDADGRLISRCWILLCRRMMRFTSPRLGICTS
jgi:Nucleoplasmin-like domain